MRYAQGRNALGRGVGSDEGGTEVVNDLHPLSRAAPAASSPGGVPTTGDRAHGQNQIPARTREGRIRPSSKEYPHARTRVGGWGFQTRTREEGSAG